MLGTFPTSTETFVLREIAALRRSGMDVAVFAVRRPQGPQAAGPGSTFGQNLSCRYARPDSLLPDVLANLLTFARRPLRYLRSLAVFVREAQRLSPRDGVQLFYHFFAGVGLSRELRRRRVTHVHCHFTSAANMALAAHLTDGTSFSFTAHASNDLFVRPILLRSKVAAARFVVPVCEYSRRYLDSITGFEYSDKLHVIHNGVDIDEPATCSGRAQSATTTRSTHHRVRLISVGSLVAPKGHATLIHACAQLRANGAPVECRIIGEGPDRRMLERLIYVTGTQDDVALLGTLPLDAVYAELQAADIFVLLCEIGPSGYRDGFPTAILEAMAAGLPVVSTTLSGIPEIVAHGVTGYLVAERAVEQATATLADLCASPDRRKQMGDAGRARVLDRFDLAGSVARLAALFEDTLWQSSMCSQVAEADPPPRALRAG